MSKPSEARLQQQLERPETVHGNVGHAGSGTQPEHGPLHSEDHADDHTHHVPMSSYYLVFGFLMLMLFVTQAASWFDLGKANAPIAVVIATMKACAIVLIFMHVRYSSRLVQIFACTGVIFASVMFLLTFNDYLTRHWVPSGFIGNP